MGGCILDEYTRNLVMWNGVGIKYCTGSNDSRETWNGYKLYGNQTVKEIAEKILVIMMND